MKWWNIHWFLGGCVWIWGLLVVIVWPTTSIYTRCITTCARGWACIRRDWRFSCDTRSKKPSISKLFCTRKFLYLTIIVYGTCFYDERKLVLLDLARSYFYIYYTSKYPWWFVYLLKSLSCILNRKKVPKYNQQRHKISNIRQVFSLP